MTRVGAIDCGTNSIRLLIADVDPVAGSLSDLVRRVEIVRLGHGVDKTGVIAPEAMARTLAQAREYASQCSELGAARGWVGDDRYRTRASAADLRRREDPPLAAAFGPDHRCMHLATVDDPRGAGRA